MYRALGWNLSDQLTQQTRQARCCRGSSNQRRAWEAHGTLLQDQAEERVAPKRMVGYGKPRLGPESSSLDENRLSLYGGESYWSLPFTPGSSTPQSFPLPTKQRSQGGGSWDSCSAWFKACLYIPLSSHAARFVLALVSASVTRGW